MEVQKNPRTIELYSNLEGYLDKLKKLDFKEDNAIRELIKLYKKDADELFNLIIEEGKTSGEINDAIEQELRIRQKRVEKTFDRHLKLDKVDKNV